MITSDGRPKYLNLIKIRLPVPGIASIAHRISGVLMFLAIPLLVYAFHLSATSEAGYAQVTGMLEQPVIKLLILLLAWSVFHHLFAGIRYLLIDIDIGIDRQSSRVSAIIVLLAGAGAAIVVLAVML